MKHKYKQQNKEQKKDPKYMSDQNAMVVGIVILLLTIFAVWLMWKLFATAWRN